MGIAMLNPYYKMTILGFGEVRMLYIVFAWLGLLFFPSFSFAEITKIVIERKELFAGGSVPPKAADF